MVQSTPQTMKKLTRIKLVNWHYFGNETIDVNGSFLLSGENASGKSTILDAIQLILTTNTRRFNPAANEKSKRDLKGYVRCKTGEEGNTYARKNSVISYVALEFYEESKDRFFVLGAKFDSPDEEAEIRRIWFCEEGTLDGFSFIVDNKPATDEQFKNNGKKIVYIRSTKEAKDRFKRRLGNLDENFFDMIPKSLAFKPMDNVKKFITQFILPEKQIEVDVLRENIRNLREMQELIKEVRKQITHLESIIETNDKMVEIKRDILVIDILLKIAEIEDKKAKIEENNKSLALKDQELKSKTAEAERTKGSLNSEQESLQAIRIDISNNECSKLIDKYNKELELLEKDRNFISSHVEVLQAQLENAIRALKFIPNIPETINMLSVRNIGKAAMLQEDRDEIFVKLSSLYKKAYSDLNAEKAEKNLKVTTLKEELSDLKKKIDNLRKNKITYPPNTIRLKKAIESEFDSRSISADVRVFADLLEIVKTEWQNAVEGYLNTQRFNIIVDPQYYDIAAEVYDRMKHQIEGVTLVNTQALDLKSETDEMTLASVVSSKNRYARAYANYLMGRVVLCDEVIELKEYPIAITAGCMLYQGKGLRKIPEDIYRIPYIGKSAIARQLEIAEADYKAIGEQCYTLEARIKEIDIVLDYIGECDLGAIERYLSSPIELDEIKKKIQKTAAELKDAQNDPNIIALQFKERECLGRVTALSKKQGELIEIIANIKRDISDFNSSTNKLKAQVSELNEQIQKLSDGDNSAILAAEQKYAEHSKTKEAGTIYDNYGRRKTVLDNQHGKLLRELISLQASYKEGEYGTGEEVVLAYAQEYRTLSNHNLIEYEEKLNKAKEDCELEFRENFLARMRENIEGAQDIFKNLNKALKNIYYGNDSYKFHYSAHSRKQGLYEMITSEVNMGGFTLFASEFEERYHSEMEDLFSKLTESDEHGDKILSEYTDYREYMDYDIEIVSKDGKSQFFSKIYGEKSGGETQTPYYVAIAASFAQMYSVGETIRIIMLDEAFDKMDDDRIENMMKFLRSQNFQIILATPPAKIETIGEYVDTVLVTYRNGYSSIVEEYDL